MDCLGAEITSEEGDMCLEDRQLRTLTVQVRVEMPYLFIVVDLLEIVVEWVRKASSHEVGLRELGNTLLVEFAL